MILQMISIRICMIGLSVFQNYVIFGQCYCVIVTIGERSATKDRAD